MKPDFSATGLRVLVTAGAAGIGRAIAGTFADAGARVHICDVDTAALAEFATLYPSVTASVTDVSDPAQVEHLFEDVRQHLGDVVYETAIPRNVRISEAPSHGKPVLHYDLRCPGSQAYVMLASELLKRESALATDQAA